MITERVTVRINTGKSDLPGTDRFLPLSGGLKNLKNPRKTLRLLSPSPIL